MYISPMLLHKSDEAFSDTDFLTEMKLDGIRLTLSKFDGKVKIYTRHKNEVTAKFKELHSIDIPDGTVLDGEIIVTDSKGKPNFEAMMERFQSYRSVHKIQYCVFDDLYYKHENMMYKPLTERKALLESVLHTDDRIAYVQHIEGHGSQYFDLIKEQGLEGIVLKKADSKYRPGTRSDQWLKVINYQYENIWITGLRKKEFGLLLSFEDGSPAGLMEFMKPSDRKKLYAEYKKHIRTETDDFIYLDPKLKGMVKYRNLTKKGYLRIPSFEKWTS
ncbi:ATP-dependent DNA ligase [Peribacillus cavernae]|uniref:ATP-dependent DNA ligase n=1 Tax=Peribacillus cavernae TaxID=1674310 RepID=A0A433HGV9_9BACI|nr:RNA ligase family protein [Peribacillus cavernae]MDQ0221109.1 DNA ligase-1 [Peribacillus cavernae]RUQ27601.1 ATP-dependent DNA ligase [Peribacillus cavernae]